MNLESLFEDMMAVMLFTLLLLAIYYIERYEREFYRMYELDSESSKITNEEEDAYPSSNRENLWITSYDLESNTARVNEPDELIRMFVKGHIDESYLERHHPTPESLDWDRLEMNRNFVEAADGIEVDIESISKYYKPDGDSQ